MAGYGDPATGLGFDPGGDYSAWSGVPQHPLARAARFLGDLGMHLGRGAVDLMAPASQFAEGSRPMGDPAASADAAAIALSTLIPARPPGSAGVGLPLGRSGSLPQIARDVVAEGQAAPLYHDTSAGGVEGILGGGQIEPRAAPYGDPRPLVYATRDFSNWSRRADSPYRLVLDPSAVGHKPSPLDVFGNRAEAEEAFSRPVPGEAVRGLYIDETNPAIAAARESGELDRVIAAAKARGVPVERGVIERILRRYGIIPPAVGAGVLGLGDQRNGRP